MTSTNSGFSKLLKSDAAGGVVLMLAALAALIASNTSLAPYYSAFLNAPVSVQISELVIAKPAVLWINDGLMAIFFFLVGLEVKRELLEGDLSSPAKATLPAIAAIGGMAGPALIFIAVNIWMKSDPALLNGWAIPAATDIAFALGVLAIAGKRAPAALKTLLLAIAIIDDLGAIVIIAAFYTAELSVYALGGAGVAFIIAVILNRMQVKSLAPYIILGIIMWVLVLKSGVHATLAGVLIALCVPLRVTEGKSPARRAEHRLHSWTSFLVLPLFAFANAGVYLGGFGLDQIFSPLPLGIALGLILGKQVGVMVASFATVKLNIASLPERVSWRHLYALSCLTGIGFTMSLFIGSLAFQDAQTMNEVRLGVLGGSVISALLGFILLNTAAKDTQR